MWEQLPDHESKCRYCRSPKDGSFENFGYPLVMSRTKIISGNGLHTLIESHYDHHKKKNHPVDNAVCSNCQIATIANKPLIDNNHDNARSRIHHKWCEANGQRIDNYLAL